MGDQTGTPLAGFLDDGTLELIRGQLRYQAWQTRYDLSQPRRDVTLFRYRDGAWQPVTGGPLPVVMQPDNYLPQRPGAAIPGGTGEWVSGILSRPLVDASGEPDSWDVAEGDAFTLDGVTARITDVPPAGNGLQLARYRIGLAAGERDDQPARVRLPITGPITGGGS